jgi:hypothetical protein
VNEKRRERRKGGAQRFELKGREKIINTRSLGGLGMTAGGDAFANIP